MKVGKLPSPGAPTAGQPADIFQQSGQFNIQVTIGGRMYGLHVRRTISYTVEVSRDGGHSMDVGNDIQPTS